MVWQIFVAVRSVAVVVVADAKATDMGITFADALLTADGLIPVAHWLRRSALQGPVAFGLACRAS